MGEGDETIVQPERKRRLSRKEQKARKKNKKNNNGATSTAAVTHSTSKDDKKVVVEKEIETATTNEQTIEDTPTPVAPQEQQQQEPEPDYLSDYESIPIPETSSNANNASSLGKWFPKAKVIKSSVSISNGDSKSKAKASLVLFYQYASWSEHKVDQLLLYLSQIAEKRKTLGGRIRVAPEGVNATVSSVDTDTTSSRKQLRHFCEDLKQFDSVFNDTDFKFIDDVSPDRHFKDLKLLPVKELVFYGIKDGEAPLKAGGTHVDARGFHSLLEQESTVVIDVRNHYEAAIGRFNGQEQKGEKTSDAPTADYIDPKMRKSTDFPAWLEKPETKEKLKNKTVLMYCTGGVRCERASAYLNTKMGEDVKGIFQLQGGIERYLQAFPDGGHWRGKNFVFDKREAISATNRDGDGGVVRGNKQIAKDEAALASKETSCCVCATPWDRYVGKKKCTMCGVPVLMCISCMSKTKKDAVLRCPLCVEEDITVPAADVEWTDNGVSGRAPKSQQDDSTEKKGKAASSVLKWGGGHARGKKEKQKEKRRKTKLKQHPCQNGKECNRPDCFFFHPGRAENNTPAKSL